VNSSVASTGDTLTLTVRENGEVYVFEFRSEAEMEARCEQLGIPVPPL